MIYMITVWRLGVVEGGNTRKDLAFQEFQRGTSSSRDVRHVSGTSRQFSGGNRVSSSDDGDGISVLGQVSQDVDDSEGSLVELFEFEDSHGSVHDDGLAVRQEFLLFFGGLGTVVKTHPSFRDGISGNSLGFGVLVELIGNDNVGRKKDGLSELFGLFHNFLGSVNEVFFNKRSTNFKTLGLEEGENHTSTNDDLVALVEESVQDSDLGGNLGSTNNGGHGLLSVGDGTVKVFKFLGKQESRDRGLEELGHTFGGGVGTVSSSKGVVDVKVEGSGQLFNEFCFVLFFFLVETSVFEEDDISFAGGINQLGDFITDAVSGKLDILSQEFSQTFSARTKGELVFRSVLGASQVRADRDDGSLALQVFNSGDGRADTGIISDGLSVKGDVQVATNKDFLSLKFGFSEVFNRLLGFKFEDRRGGDRADTESGCWAKMTKDPMVSVPIFRRRENAPDTDAPLQSALFEKLTRSESFSRSNTGSEESEDGLGELHGDNSGLVEKVRTSQGI